MYQFYYKIYRPLPPLIYISHLIGKIISSFSPLVSMSPETGKFIYSLLQLYLLPPVKKTRLLLLNKYPPETKKVHLVSFSTNPHLPWDLVLPPARCPTLPRTTTPAPSELQSWTGEIIHHPDHHHHPCSPQGSWEAMTLTTSSPGPRGAGVWWWMVDGG